MRGAPCVVPGMTVRRPARRVQCAPAGKTGSEMLYPELFKAFEAVRWNLESDVPWHAFDAARLSDEQARTIKMNAITEWAALPATEMFLRDNRHDSDFCAFMSIWFYEEQKHALALMEYLQPVPSRPRADRSRTARGPLRVRSRAGVRDADAAFLRRDPPQPLVSLRVRVAHRARDQEDLRPHFPRRGASRRRVPALHEERDRARRRRGEARVREDRRADGERRARGQGAAPDEPAREPRNCSRTTPSRAACRTRRGSSAGSTSRSASTPSGKSGWSA